MMSGSPNHGVVPQPLRSEPLAPSPGVAPFLRKPVAPFAGRSRRRRAATGAMFYAECSLQGISAKEADDAAKDSQAHFQNWWLQDRFKKKPADMGGGVGGGGAKVRRGKRDSSNGGPKSRGGDARLRCGGKNLGGSKLEPMPKLPRIPETPAGESQTESGESQCESGEVSRRKRRRSFLDSISGPAGRDPSPPAKRRDGSDDEGDGCGEDYENSSNSSMPSSRGMDEDVEAHQQSGEASTCKAPAPVAMEEADITTTKPVIPEELTALSEEMRAKRIEMAKAELLEALAENDGETTGPRFLAALEVLKVMYSTMGVNACDDGDDGKQGFSALLDGVWLTMSKPNFHECLGKNPQGEYKYTLGRMSFDMFLPTKVVCSIQGVFNPVFVTETIPDAVPRTLRKEIQSKNSTLRTYNIVVAFTVDEESLDEGDKDKTNEGPNKRKRLDDTPLQGVMTTYGYILPDPNVPNRVSVWFTGGVLEANDETDVDSWERVFGGNLPKRALKERARLLAAKLLLGASAPDGIEEDGSMSYYLKRPIGGHGVVYCDVLYLDESLRIMRGHHGTIYVTSRVPPCYAD